MLWIAPWHTPDGRVARHIATIVRDGTFYGTVTLGLLPEAVLRSLKR